MNSSMDYAPSASSSSPSGNVKTRKGTTFMHILLYLMMAFHKSRNMQQ